MEIQVNTKLQSFPLDGVDSPWAVSASLRGIFRFIQANLHPETKRREVEYAAVDGLLSTLDCHSVLLRPEFFGEMQIHTEGSFGGLGITISRCGHPAVLTVVKPLDGTPAQRAGLKAGDQIVRIVREDTGNLTLNEAVKRLRGEPGSKVNIWVRRKGQAPRQFTLERDRILIRAVEHRMLADSVGYLQLKNFQATTDWELRVALQDLQRQGMKGLVLDLRGNGGGLLSKAISVADAFLFSGTIVTTVEHGVKRRESRASWGNTLAGQATARRAGGRRHGLGIGNRGRGLEEPRSRRDHRTAHVREGLCPGHLPQHGSLGLQGDHRPVPPRPATDPSKASA